MKFKALIWTVILQFFPWHVPFSPQYIDRNIVPYSCHFTSRASESREDYIHLLVVLSPKVSNTSE